MRHDLHDGVSTFPRICAVAGVAVCGALMLAACATGGVLRPQVEVGSGFTPAKPRIGRSLSSLVGRIGFPRITPVRSEATPQSELACRARLRKLGVTFRDLPPIDDGGGCGIDYPVKVSGLPRGVKLTPAATLNCRMAESFARWTRNELAPAARWRYFSGIREIRQGSSYSCRTIGNRRGGRLSEHATGNALDIMDITLKSGRNIDIRKPGLFSFRQRGLLKSVRGDACDYFSTVLGPGYDRAHKDHFHFDLMERRSGRTTCR